MRSLPLQFTFADLELQFQGVHLDPILRAISQFLDQNLTLIEQVRKDLERGLKNARTGRNGIAPSQVLRSLVLMRVKNWDYRELQERINDGFTLRSFTGFDSQPVPKHDAFHRAFNRVTPQTLRDINQLVVQAAVQLGLEDGKTLRVDTTVVESNIHYPTDATLLWDAVRTITRLIEDLQEKLPDPVQGFTNRTRSARRRMQAIQRMSAAERTRQQEPKYRELIRIAEQVVNNARQVVEKTKAAAASAGADLMASLIIDSLRHEITGYCTLADRVIDQSRRRGFRCEVLEGGDSGQYKSVMRESGLGREPEQLADEVSLADGIPFNQPSHSALPDHVHRLDSLQRPPRTLKGSIAFGQPNSFLNRPVVLFNHVIEILALT